MTTRLLHLSDLHVGGGEEVADERWDAVRALVAAREPEVVVATGDLAHRNRAWQHRRAAELLQGLGPPVLAVPGNHDLPALPPRRLTSPFAAFLREWPETEPTYRSDGLVVCCLNSVRPWKYQRGALSRRQLERAAGVLGSAPTGALRVVALHHNLTSPPWRTGKRSVPRRSRVLAALADAGAHLVISGHAHQGLVAGRREFWDLPAAAPAPVIASAPGAGRPRPGRHAEAAGAVVVEANASEIRIETYAWVGDRLDRVGEHVYERARSAERPAEP